MPAWGFLASRYCCALGTTACAMYAELCINERLRGSVAVMQAACANHRLGEGVIEPRNWTSPQQIEITLIKPALNVTSEVVTYAT